MRRRKVVVTPEAHDDLLRLYDWLARASSPDVALGYVERLEAFCLSFDIASERGQRRDDLREGLRITGFEGRVTIAFAVEEESVTVHRFFYGGRDWESALS